MQTTSTSTLRRVSTHTSTTSTTTSSRVTPSIHTRRSTDSRVLLEDVLADGDEIGPGRFIHDQPISIVNARSPNVNPLRVIRKLGTGSYAVVYLVQEILTDDARADPQDSFLDIGQDSPPLTPSRRLGRYFAVKCLAKHALDQEAQLLEATIHQSLPVHPNVVTLWTTLETASHLLLVLDYVPGEDLFYWLEQAKDHVEASTEEATVTPPVLASLHPNQLLSHPRLKLVANMFTQMCDAVAHCHRNGVFHRDLKPENFMVTESWEMNPITGERERKVSVKLTDFGLATRDVESGDMDCGSAPYMSYECHNNITPTYATAPADVWSLGIVLINMLYHANPWLSTAAGHCQSFEYYLREPIPFFMERFPGMTPAVAEFFARRVFCLLPVPDQHQPPIASLSNVGRRITADEFGRWARDLPLHLGPAARRTPALAFARPPSPSPPTESRPQTPTNNNANRLATSVSQPGTRTPSPSFHARPSIPSPQPSSVETQMLDGGIIDLASDEEEEPRSRNGTGTGSKRRKRAPRGKSQSTSQPFSPLTTNNGTGAEEMTDAALYAATVLAEKMQNVAREASAIKTGKTPPASAPVPLPATVTAPAHTAAPGTATASSSLSTKPTITLSTKRSIPELRHKKSAKWLDVFRRDSGSDQDVATADEVADAFNSPVQAMAPVLNAVVVNNAQKQQPTPMAKNIASVVMSLDSTSPPPSVHSRNGSEHGSNRGRRKTRPDRGNSNGNMNSVDSSSQRDVSPGSLMSVSTSSTGKSWGRNRSVPAAPTTPTAPNPERRARSKSPTSSLSEAFNIMARKTTSDAPPVPVVPEPFRMPPSFGPMPPLYDVPPPTIPDPYVVASSSSPSRKSYAPSISSVSTATTASSVFTGFSGKKRWTGSSSNSSRYSASNASVRSVSTNATSVSSGSGSWRVGAGWKKDAPPPVPRTNVKNMDGVPWELAEMPRQMAHRPDKHVFSQAPKSSNNKKRPPTAPSSPTPGASFGLEPISERPRKKSAMKQPQSVNQAASGSSSQLHQESQGMFYGEQPPPGSVLEGGSTDFFPPPKSFGAGRGGMPAGLIQVNTDAANAYLSAGVAGNGMAIQSTDGISTTSAPTAAAAAAVRQPKTPISQRLFGWRNKSSTRVD